MRRQLDEAISGYRVLGAYLAIVDLQTLDEIDRFLVHGAIAARALHTLADSAPAAASIIAGIPREMIRRHATPIPSDKRTEHLLVTLDGGSFEIAAVAGLIEILVANAKALRRETEKGPDGRPRQKLKGRKLDQARLAGDLIAAFSLAGGTANINKARSGPFPRFLLAFHEAMSGGERPSSPSALVEAARKQLLQR